jgi:hypothetical protein
LLLFSSSNIPELRRRSQRLPPGVEISQLERHVTDGTAMQSFLRTLPIFSDWPKAGGKSKQICSEKIFIDKLSDYF